MLNLNIGDSKTTSYS